MLTRDQVMNEACAILALAFHSIGDYTKPNDGFCSRCPAQHGSVDFQSGGEVLAYVRLAVVEKLTRDGHAIHQGFDDVTGKELAL